MLSIFVRGRRDHDGPQERQLSMPLLHKQPEIQFRCFIQEVMLIVASLVANNVAVMDDVECPRWATIFNVHHAARGSLTLMATYHVPGNNKAGS